MSRCSYWGKCDLSYLLGKITWKQGYEIFIQHLQDLAYPEIEGFLFSIDKCCVDAIALEMQIILKQSANPLSQMRWGVLERDIAAAIGENTDKTYFYHKYRWGLEYHLPDIDEVWIPKLKKDRREK
jgi:hypothetical protein